VGGREREEERPFVVECRLWGLPRCVRRDAQRLAGARTPPRPAPSRCFIHRTACDKAPCCNGDLARNARTFQYASVARRKASGSPSMPGSLSTRLATPVPCLRTLPRLSWAASGCASVAAAPARRRRSGWHWRAAPSLLRGPSGTASAGMPCEREELLSLLQYLLDDAFWGVYRPCGSSIEGAALCCCFNCCCWRGVIDGSVARLGWYAYD